MRVLEPVESLSPVCGRDRSVEVWNAIALPSFAASRRPEIIMPDLVGTRQGLTGHDSRHGRCLKHSCRGLANV